MSVARELTKRNYQIPPPLPPLPRSFLRAIRTRPSSVAFRIPLCFPLFDRVSRLFPLANSPGFNENERTIAFDGGKSGTCFSRSGLVIRNAAEALTNALVVDPSDETQFSIVVICKLRVPRVGFNCSRSSRSVFSRRVQRLHRNRGHSVPSIFNQTQSLGLRMSISKKDQRLGILAQNPGLRLFIARLFHGRS